MVASKITLLMRPLEQKLTDYELQKYFLFQVSIAINFRKIFLYNSSNSHCSEEIKIFILEYIKKIVAREFQSPAKILRIEGALIFFHQLEFLRPSD